MEKGREDGQLPVIGAFVMAVPWILHYADKPAEECSQNTVEALRLTHPTPSLEPYLTLYSHLLHAVLHGAELRAEIRKAAKSNIFGSRGQLEEFLDEASESSKYVSCRISPGYDCLRSSSVIINLMLI